MARIRTIKPTFFASLTIADLPLSARLTFIGLWTYCDDAGRGRDDVRLVKAALWPLDDTHNLRKVEADLASLEKANLIERYAVDGQRYLRVRSWQEHQRINRPTASIHPLSPEEAVTPPTSLTEDSSPEGKGREGNQDQGTDGTAERGEPARKSEAPTEAAPPPETGSSNGTRRAPWKDDPLVARWCDEVSHNHRSTHQVQTWNVISHLRAHVDEAAIDETIGRLAKLDSKVTSPNFLLTTVTNWAAERDIRIPPMETR